MYKGEKVMSFLDERVNEEYKNKIVKIANEFYEQKVKEAKHYDENFIKYPHLFLLGAVMDSQIGAKKAWNIPFIIADELGGKDFSLFCAKDYAWYKEQFETKKLHRFNEVMSDAFYSAVVKIKNEYNSNAANIWNDTPTSAELVCRLLEFKKVGIKIATMVANLLSRDCGVILKDKHAIDISPDVHVKRAMYRLGLLPKIENVDFKSIENNKIIYAAKSLNPEFAGVLDPVFWEIGNKGICANDGCKSNKENKCPFADFCIRQK